MRKRPVDDETRIKLQHAARHVGPVGLARALGVSRKTVMIAVGGGELGAPMALFVEAMAVGLDVRDTERPPAPEVA